MKAVLLEAGAINSGDLSWDKLEDICELTIFDNTTEDNKYEHIGDSEIVLVNKVIMDEELFSRCPNIKYVGVCATGYNVIDLEAARRHGVVVTNVPAYSTDSVVQLTWAMILENACKLSMHNESVKNGDWVRSETFCYWKEPMMELAGKTLGIIGFGNIGSKVARLALDFGMNVLVSTAHPEKYDEKVKRINASYIDDNDEVKDSSRLQLTTIDEVLSKSDIISLHCPMTDETDKIIRKENINKMKDGVILINVSRGGLVNEKDLADALNSGKVKAAAVDVVSVEPMKADNPLLTAQNITITPHMAWASLEARERLVDVVASNLKSFLDGEKQNVVNK
ncbi:D-2-hydroxyacid dehydrogenase [uncultured Eubacterium sp.]|uniref:D-2-hydroxyacid dehydrogenase n=1 Tax=uncultured Eubacterium sp. TaxID=165185 RepID=UPI00259789F4|nr:D-2-hydroxyacid dehydrogenase [uncultured Eubacterium sp.]